LGIGNNKINSSLARSKKFDKISQSIDAWSSVHSGNKEHLNETIRSDEIGKVYVNNDPYSLA
jgi:hypothetical protein